MKTRSQSRREQSLALDESATTSLNPSLLQEQESSASTSLSISASTPTACNSSTTEATELVSASTSTTTKYASTPNGISSSSSTQPSVSALHLAVMDGDLPLVEKLIKTDGMDPNSIADMGWTPLRYACTRGDVGMCHTLVNNGAKVNDETGVRKWTCLHACAGLDQLECLKYLVSEAGAVAKTQNVDGFSALHVAVVYGNKGETIRLLVKNGQADMEQRDDAGDTALALACQNHRLPAIDILLFELLADPFGLGLFPIPTTYDDCVKDLLLKAQQEERDRNQAFVDALRVTRLLLLVHDNGLLSAELQLLCLSQLTHSRSNGTLSKAQFNSLAYCLLDRRSIGMLVLAGVRLVDKEPRLHNVVTACQIYLDS